MLSTLGYSQIVNIPDPNFKNALINTNCANSTGTYIREFDVDFNNDGEIQVSILTITTSRLLASLTISP